MKVARSASGPAGWPGEGKEIEMVKANPLHASMYLNYRSMYKTKYGKDWTGSDNVLEGILEEYRGMDNEDGEHDEVVLHEMANP